MKIDPQRLSPAELLLWSYGVTAPAHIELEEIAYDHGATVNYEPLFGCEARLVAFYERAIITIDSASSVGRRRFSLAHELAHWIRDRESGSFLCAKEDITPQDYSAKIVEARANIYASQLILPNYLVDPWMKRRPVSLDLASSLAKEFNTSLTAAAIRLVQRTNESACLVCYSQTGFSWKQTSIPIPTDYYFHPRLHPETDAARLALSGSSGITPPIIEPAIFWISGRGVSRLEITAQSVRLRDDAVLTMFTI